MYVQDFECVNGTFQANTSINICILNPLLTPIDMAVIICIYKSFPLFIAHVWLLCCHHPSICLFSLKIDHCDYHDLIIYNRVNPKISNFQNTATLLLFI